MKAAPFDYLRASSLDEAAEALAGTPDARVLAGGQSLVPLLNLRQIRPPLVVDINRLDGLSFLRTDNGRLEIGALTRHRVVEMSEAVRSDVPLLAEAIGYVGHAAIRNRGTIGGSLAHAEPAAELPAVMVALDAEFGVHGPGGERLVAARDFFLGPHRTALGPGELLTRISVPARQGGHAVEELSRRSRELPLVAVFAAVTMSGDVCEAARIAVGGAGPTPIRATTAEESLVGSALTADAIAVAAELAAAATDPPSDLHAPPGYRREMTAVLTRRAIARAKERA
ncbi:FAD binding domain-containing protein [Amycolatopsis regifaucium]|uniref:Molybdopterin dehydrogenase n=1 Tax=Amycolatopsis regifaucium TaxID=546365 RepID=A0A154MI73_9PSEU|nr:xanthine dehydrogenase family protein subunit M [Amycolatopsis regifaucium]KZB83820.1 molybdopterin dehydrogenase [Amycolatopsis regifaucium]OKA06737.1 molybdopterin dehydrogenase [Amycolatopsis regifaucium]SFH25581.1 carbon-monoxide dehydrogenase medium subunit [Amycolatopsis regifaucium]